MICPTCRCTGRGQLAAKNCPTKRAPDCGICRPKGVNYTQLNSVKSAASRPTQQKVKQAVKLSLCSRFLVMREIFPNAIIGPYEIRNPQRHTRFPKSALAQRGWAADSWEAFWLIAATMSSFSPRYAPR